MPASHVVVWLDHSEAHVIGFNRDEALAPVIVRASTHHPHQHQHFHSHGAGKTNEDAAYYAPIVAAINGIAEWLIVGPGNAKLGLVKHISGHHPLLLDHLLGVETVDHPSDGQLLHYAKQYFVAADRMRGAKTAS
jgi:hypothetical protein